MSRVNLRQTTPQAAEPRSDPRGLYLDLVKRSVLGLIDEDPPAASFSWSGANWSPSEFNRELRVLGRDLPTRALSMIGLERMNNVQFCIQQVLRRSVPGDLVEAGVWRGGTAIFMRAALMAFGVTDRLVWVADSFEGCPAPNPTAYPADEGFDFSLFNDVFAVSMDEVRGNFQRYGLLDDQVRFVKGWFKDTLPTAPIDAITVLRIDCDLYESTTDVLTSLYSKVSPGGFCIIDDYNILCCVKAVEDFRRRMAITEPLRSIDDWGVYWQRR